jgi:predicted DNA-binding transcriptional regulator AlpA
MPTDDPNRPRKNSSRHRHRDKQRRHRHRDKSCREKRSKRHHRYSERSMTIAEFCKLHGIGRSTFYDLCKRGLGPRMLPIGRGRRISAEANRDWIKMMEASLAQPVPRLDAVKPQHAQKNEELVARKHRAKPRKTRGRQHAKHRRHDPRDE